MRKSIFAPAVIAISLLSATMAAAKGHIINKFYHKATGYKVTVMEAPNDGRVLEGVHKETGETFTMYVTYNGIVTGDYQGKPVHMRVTNSGKVIHEEAELASK
jgi:hypothetical protein